MKMYNVWKYDTIKAERRLKHLSNIRQEWYDNLTLEEKEFLKKDYKKFYDSLNCEEKALFEVIENNQDKIKKRYDERIKKYDGGKIVTSKNYKIDTGFDTKKVHKFTAILKNGKIGIFLDDHFNQESLFCDFLCNKEELRLFFDSIEIKQEELEVDYKHIFYRDVPFTTIEDYVHVGFELDEKINNGNIKLVFLGSSNRRQGFWYWENDNNYWNIDSLTYDRDDIIKMINDIT